MHVSFTRKTLYISSIAMLAMAATFAQSKTQRLLSPVSGSPDAANYSPASGSPIDESANLHILLSFKNVDDAGSDAFVLSQSDPDSPNFQHWITPAEYGAKFGAPAADIQTVTSYLATNGFTNISVFDNKQFVEADATVANAEKAFNTKLANFVRPSELVAKGDPATFFAPETTPQMPVQVASRVRAAYGLTDLLIQHHVPFKTVLTQSSNSLSQSPNLTAYGYGPATLSTAYNTNAIHTAGATGSGMAIAVVSPTKRVSTDITTFASAFSLTGFTVADVKVGTGPAKYTGPDEASLDIETIIGQAPKSHVYVYEPDGSPAGEINMMTAITNARIPVTSSSWDFEEYDVIQAGAQQFASDWDTAAKTASATGMTIFVAAGDSGAYDRNGHISNSMEASSPHVVSMGGTALFVNADSSYNSENYWNFSSGSGGGGGISKLYARPSWQTGPGVSNTYSNGKRQCPDVSGNADPNTPYAIFTSSSASNGTSHTAGQWTGIGGTSASTPLWASNTLLMDQRLRTVSANTAYKLGLINPALYWLGTQFETASKTYAGLFYQYHDIKTAGSNGVQPVTNAWDFCTGFGSTDFYRMMQDLGSYFKVATLGPDYTPYNPHAVTGFSTWNKPLMLSTKSTAVAEPTSFNHTTTYYFACAMLNHGNANSILETNAIYVDGVLAKTFTFRALAPGFFGYAFNAYSRTFTAGTHTIKLVVNNGNTLRDLSTANNTYTRTITVG